MSKTIIMMIISSSLTLSGCLSSPSNGDKKIEEESLKLLWSYSYDPDGGSPKVLPLVHDDKIISSGDISVTAVDYKTGKEIWKTPFESTHLLTNRTFGSNGQQLVGSVFRKLISWNLNSGEQLWEIHFPDSVTFGNLGGVTHSDNQFFVIGDYFEFHRISTGGHRHTIELDARSYETTVVENVLFATQRLNNKGFFSAYDVPTMNLLWRFEPGAFGFGTRVPPIIEDGIAYVGTVGGPGDPRNGFFALNATTGQEIWRREGIFTYAAILVDDRIYGVNGNNVWALNKSTGQMVWSTNSQGGGHGEGTLAWLDGYLYWSHSSGLHVFKGSTGELVHVEPAPDRTYYWLVTADKGRIFAQTSSHLYAFAPWGHEEALE